MPRPDATPAFINAIQSPYVKPAILVQIEMISETVYVWSGVGSLGFPGNTYAGVGQFGMLSSVEEGSDLQARGIVLSLSGIDPTLLNEVLTDYRQGLTAIVYLGVFDSLGVLQAITSFSGRTDQPTITVSGETATISIACENRLVEMNTTSSFRRYTSEDQRIDYPDDLAFAAVNSIQQQQLYWGRLPDRQNFYIPTTWGG